MIGQKKIKHKLKLSKSIIVIAVLFTLYMLAIFSPTVILSFRIIEISDLRNANCYAINNSTSPETGNVEQYKELYQYLTSTDLKIYTMFSYLASDHNSAKIPIEQSYANEAFCELQSFNFKEGQAFDKMLFHIRQMTSFQL